MKKPVKIAISLFLVSMLILSCSIGSLQEKVFSGRYAFLIFLARVCMQLSSFDNPDNVKAMDDLGTRYDLEVTTTTQEFFQSANAMVRMLIALQHAIKTDSSRGLVSEDIQELSEALEQEIEADKE